jgi:hypothetical protein
MTLRELNSRLDKNMPSASVQQNIMDGSHRLKCMEEQMNRISKAHTEIISRLSIVQNQQSRLLEQQRTSTRSLLHATLGDHDEVKRLLKEVYMEDLEEVKEEVRKVMLEKTEPLSGHVRQLKDVVETLRKASLQGPSSKASLQDPSSKAPSFLPPNVSAKVEPKKVVKVAKPVTKKPLLPPPVKTAVSNPKKVVKVEAKPKKVIKVTEVPVESTNELLPTPKVELLPTPINESKPPKTLKKNSLKDQIDSPFPEADLDKSFIESIEKHVGETDDEFLQSILALPTKLS